MPISAAENPPLPGGEASALPSPEPVPLTHLRRGESGIIRRSALDAADAAFVRALGLRNDRLLRVCRHGSPCIVEVSCGRSVCSRVALSPAIAAGVRVEP